MGQGLERNIGPIDDVTTARERRSMRHYSKEAPTATLMLRKRSNSRGDERWLTSASRM
jgi:hypothetical protein